MSVLASKKEDCRFDSCSGQTKDYKIGICWLSSMHPTLRRESKDLLALNQNNVFKWSDLSTSVLLLLSELSL